MKKITILSLKHILVILAMMANAVWAEAWQAQWIGLDTDCPANTWLCFRKQINLDEAPSRARARIACDSK